MSFVKRCWVIIVFGLVVAACGGSQSGVATAGDDAPSDRDGETNDGHSNSDDSDSETGPAQPSCSDGTCFRCGDGICPKGFYCDKDAKGGPACGWLPSCAEEPSCSCLKATLGQSCSCDEEGGGISVGCE